MIFVFITGFTRAQLYNFVGKHGIERDVMFFATDSICTTRELDVNSSKLGDFSFDNEANDVFVLQNRFYRFNGKDMCADCIEKKELKKRQREAIKLRIKNFTKDHWKFLISTSIAIVFGIIGISLI